MRGASNKCRKASGPQCVASHHPRLDFTVFGLVLEELVSACTEVICILVDVIEDFRSGAQSDPHGPELTSSESPLSGPSHRYSERHNRARFFILQHADKGSECGLRMDINKLWR